MTESSSLWDAELAAVDFETTGLSPDRGDRAIEVAVVRGRYGHVPQAWSTLLHPERPVGATEIHGITDEMLSGQPRFVEVAPTLSRLLGGAILVAHNARFDLAFLDMECARAGLTAPEVPVIDTLGLSRRVLALPSHRLSAVCEHLGIGRGRAHRALDDAEATWEMAWQLLDRADPERRLTVEDAERLCRRPNTEELKVVLDALLAAALRHEPITIDYRSSDAQATRRAITVQRVLGSRVEAFCHLRGEDRVFRMDRISLV
ncbi:MAG: exonuclease domain-containing protein [Pseudomonadota bacterium]|nr:exonuclease domain-containing protein [Pseudomonadota bacterium]